MLIDRARLGVARAFGRDRLLFGESHQELVGVLGGAHANQTRRVDLVEDGYFRIQAGIGRKRIPFEVVDLRLESLGISADGADGRESRGIGAVRELDGGILRLHTSKFIGVHVGEGLRIVSAQLRRSLSVTGKNGFRLTEVRTADPDTGIGVGVDRRAVPPLRELRAIAGRHVL